MGTSENCAGLLACMVVSFFPGFVFYWSVNEFTRNPMRQFLNDCVLVENVSQPYECTGSWGRGPTWCTSKNVGWNLFVLIDKNNSIPLLPEWDQATCDCCELNQECRTISTQHMPSYSSLWLYFPETFNGCWYDNNNAYLQSDDKKLQWAYFWIIASSFYFVLCLFCLVYFGLYEIKIKIQQNGWVEMMDKK
jgi:hypothetical protein